MNDYIEQSLTNSTPPHDDCLNNNANHHAREHLDQTQGNYQAGVLDTTQYGRPTTLEAIQSRVNITHPQTARSNRLLSRKLRILTARSERGFMDWLLRRSISDEFDKGTTAGIIFGALTGAVIIFAFYGSCATARRSSIPTLQTSKTYY